MYFQQPSLLLRQEEVECAVCLIGCGTFKDISIQLSGRGGAEKVDSKMTTVMGDIYNNNALVGCKGGEVD